MYSGEYDVCDVTLHECAITPGISGKLKTLRADYSQYSKTQKVADLIPILSGSARSGKLFSLPGESNTPNTTNITRPTISYIFLTFVYDLYYI